jgi:hypothetical protein
MKNRLKLKIWAIFLLVLFFGWIYADNTIFKGGFNSQEVVVANDKLPIDTIIDYGHLTVQKIPNEYVTKEMITNPGILIGKRTTSVIEKYDTFSKNKIGDAELRKDKDEDYFAVPSTWIESIPGSLRRLDTIDLWLNKSEENTKTGDSPTKVSNLEEEMKNASKPIASDITVAFIKNSQNTEVQGVDQKTDRLDGNSSPAQIEVLMKKEDFSMLSAAIAEGYKLIVSY